MKAPRLAGVVAAMETVNGYGSCALLERVECEAGSGSGTFLLEHDDAARALEIGNVNA